MGPLVNSNGDGLDVAQGTKVMIRTRLAAAALTLALALFTIPVPVQADSERTGLPDVPVDAFWSISVYNAQGRFQKNDLNAYSLNNIIVKKAGDGSVAVQFGGGDGKIANCLPIV